MSIREYLNLLWRYWGIMAIALAIGLIASAMRYEKAERMYRSTAELRLILAEEKNDWILNVNASTSFLIKPSLSADKALRLLSSKKWKQAVIEGLSFPSRAEELHYILDYKWNESSNILVITATHKDQEFAQELLATSISTYQSLLRKTANDELDQNVTVMRELITDLDIRIKSDERALFLKEKELGVHGIQGAAERYQNEISRLQGKINDSRLLLRQTREKLSLVKERLEKKPYPLDQADPSEDMLTVQAKIVELAAELNAVALTVTEQHSSFQHVDAALQKEEIRLRHLTIANQLTYKENHKKEIEKSITRLTEDVDSHTSNILFLEETLKSRLEFLTDFISNHRSLLQEERTLQSLISRYQQYHKILSELRILQSYDRNYLEVLSDPDDSTQIDILGVPMTDYWFILLVSIIVGIMVAYLLNLFDLRIQSDSDVRRYLNLPVLARIPRLAKGAEKLISADMPARGIGEIFRGLAIILENSYVTPEENVILVSGANKAEGKSIVSANLSIAFARNGKKTLLLDGDLRAASQYKSHGVKKRGLTNFYMDVLAESKETIDISKYIQPHPTVVNLY